MELARDAWLKTWPRLGAVALLLGAVAAWAQTPAPNPADLPPGPTMMELAERAALTHPSVRARQAEVSGALAAVEGARYQYYPTPTLQTERGNAGSSNTLLRVQQPLYTWGRIEATVSAAESRAGSARAAVGEARYNAALRATDAWQALLAAQGQRLVNQQNVQRLEKLSQMIDRRVQASVSPRIEQDLLRARLVQARIELVSAQASEASALQRLMQWTGELPDDVFQQMGARALAEVVLWPPLPDLSRKGVQQAVLSHPLLLRLSAEIEAAQQDVALRDAQRWPQIYARLERQLSSGSGSTVSPGTRAYVGVEYTPGAGLTAQAQVQVAQARVQVLEQDREAQKLELAERLSAEWREYESAKERARQSRSVLSSNNEVLESYSRLFVAGRRSWLEVLNAARELAQAEQAQAILESQWLGAGFRLLLQTGSMPWQTSAQP